MRSILLISLFFTLTVFGATKYLQGDAVKSLDLSKTWLMPSSNGTILHVASSDSTAAISGDLTVSNNVLIGNQGTESSGININGTTFDSSFKVSDINGTDYAQTILHRHSTTLEPLILGARSNSNTSSHAAVTAGQNLFTIYGAGSAGTNYKLFGSMNIAASSSGTISGDSSPGKIIFNVTPNGSVTPAAAVTIENSKDVTMAGGLVVTGVSSLNGTATISGDLTLSNGGINFPSSPVACAANKLCDYEQGSWTPVLLGTTTSGSGTYSTQSGTYTKIGRFISASGYIVLTNHTGTGNISMSGFPFTASSDYYSCSVSEWGNLTLAGYTHASVYIASGSAVGSLIQNANGVASTGIAMDTAFSFMWTCNYNSTN